MAGTMTIDGVERQIKEYKYNSVFESYNKDNSEYQILLGSASSGKSYHAMFIEFMKFMQIPGYNILCIRRFFSDCRNSQIKLIRGFISEYATPYGYKIIENKSEHTFTNLHNGNQIHVSGVQDEKATDRLKSFTFQNGEIECIMIDEATQLMESQVNFLDSRFRGPNLVRKYLPNHVRHMVLIFNPVSASHWIKSFFKLHTDINGVAYSERDDTFVLKVTYLDNAFFDKADEKKLLRYKETSDLLYQTLALGNWGEDDKDNSVIPYSTIQKALRDYPKGSIEVEPDERIDIGLDAAGIGADSAVIMAKQGRKWLTTMVKDKCSSVWMRDAVIFLIDKLRSGKSIIPSVHVKIDATNEGQGAYDKLVEYYLDDDTVTIYDMKFGSTEYMNEKGKYKNLATEMYFKARDLIPFMELNEKANKCFAELSRRKFKIDDNTQKLIIESKDSYKAANDGESPDFADAFVLMCHPTQGATGKRAEVVKNEILSRKQRLKNKLGGF